MPPSIQISPSRPLDVSLDSSTVRNTGAKLCPINSKIITNIAIGERKSTLAPLAISGYAHRTPLERSCVEAIHGTQRVPEYVFPKL